MFDPIEGPLRWPNTRLGLATVMVWHNADHYGQMALYLRERTTSCRPPAGLPRRELHDSY